LRIHFIPRHINTSTSSSHKTRLKVENNKNAHHQCPGCFGTRTVVETTTAETGLFAGENRRGLVLLSVPFAKGCEVSFNSERINIKIEREFDCDCVSSGAEDVSAFVFNKRRRTEREEKGQRRFLVARNEADRRGFSAIRM